MIYVTVTLGGSTESVVEGEVTNEFGKFGGASHCKLESVNR